MFEIHAFNCSAGLLLWRSHFGQGRSKRFLYRTYPTRVERPSRITSGYLLVYSATDRFDDGGTFYYPHSSYSIYTAAGKLFKNVENHISRSDEIPALVTLPAGSYTILLRSENRGYIRLPIVITAGRRTILDPDEAQTDLQKRFAPTQGPARRGENRHRTSSSFLAYF